MDRDRLMGGYVEHSAQEIEEIALRQAQAQAKAEKRERKERQKQERAITKAEKIRGPFGRLLNRNDAVIEAVDKLTLKSDPYYDLAKEDRRKVVVVIDKHPETEMTPDHYAVCGVTSVGRKDWSNNYPCDRVSAEFAFAIVPASELESIINSPHHLHDSRTPGILFDPEESPSTREIRQTQAYPRPLGKGIAFVRLNRSISQAETNLALVMDAVSDHRLNAHLYSADEAAVTA